MQLARPECQPDYEEILRRVGRSLDAMMYMQRESGLFSAIMREGDYFGDTYRESAVTRDVVHVHRLGLALYSGLQCLDMLRRIDLILAETRLKCLAEPGIDVFLRDSRQKHNWQAPMSSHSLETLGVMGRIVKFCSNYPQFDGS